MEFIHEGAGAIVDGFARDCAIVRVHHPVDEADRHPFHDQLCLRRDHGLKKFQRIGGVWIMAVYSIFKERLEPRMVLSRGEYLKGSDTDVACGNASDHRARQRGFAVNGFAGLHGCQRPRRGNAKRVHGFRDNVLAQHRTQPGAPVAVAGIGGWARSLKLNVAAPDRTNRFPHQNGAPVAKLRVPLAKLVPGIKLRERLGPLRHGIAHEHLCKFRVVRCALDAQIGGQRGVEGNQPGFRNLGCVHPREQAIWQAGVGIVKRDRKRHGGYIGVKGAVGQFRASDS